MIRSLAAVALVIGSATLTACGSSSPTAEEPSKSLPPGVSATGSSSVDFRVDKVTSTLPASAGIKPSPGQPAVISNGYYSGDPSGSSITIPVVGTLPHGNVPGYVTASVTVQLSSGVTLECVDAPRKRRAGMVFNSPDGASHSIEVDCPLITEQPAAVTVHPV